MLGSTAISLPEGSKGDLRVPGAILRYGSGEGVKSVGIAARESARMGVVARTVKTT
jgi:hypothetical protein